METTKDASRSKRHLILTTSALTTLFYLSVGAPAYAQTSSAPTAKPPAEDNTLVIVTGIRRSIQDALTVKKNSELIMDTISATDIGKLPDQNITETLSRIPGVQISRLEGSGYGFNVRGISNNKLQLNGNNFVGSGSNGDPALSDLSPELLAAVDVIKAPSADVQEGWLGAIVNLRTKRPLDFKKPLFSARLQGSYTDLAEKYGNKASFFYTTKFLGGKAGVSIGASYAKTNGRSDSYSSTAWSLSNAAVDVTGDGVKDKFFWPTRFQNDISLFDDTNKAVNISLQWRPIEQLTMTLTGAASNRVTDRTFVSQQMILSTNISNAVILSDQTLGSGTFNNVTLRPLIYAHDGNAASNTAAFNATYKTGNWVAHFNASHGDGNASGANNGNSNVLILRQLNPTNLVSLNYSVGNEVSPFYTINTNFDRFDPTQFEVFSVFDAEAPRHNTGHDADFDVQYNFQNSFVQAIKVGARTETLRIDTRSIQAAYPPFSTYDPTPATSLRGNEVPGLHYGEIITDFMGDKSGAFPRVMLGGTSDIEQIRSFLHATGPDFSSVASKQTLSKVAQKTDAAFIKMDFASSILGLEYFGNIGVRQVNTTRTADGYQIVGATATPLSVTREFKNTLPSLNLIFKPSSDWRVRFNASKVLSRPPLTSAGVAIGLISTSMTGGAGNPDLKPYTATQYDLSTEWYFAPSSLLSVAFFKKDVSAFTRNVVFIEDHPEAPNNTTGATVYSVSRPVNGKSGKVRGWELNLQQALTFLPGPFDGLGYSVNYTHSTSITPNVDQLSGQALALPGQAAASYNAILYYEKGPFSGRVAYNYRGGYSSTQQGTGSGGSQFASPYAQLDASASWTLSDHLRLTVDAVNLSRSVISGYTGTQNRLTGSSLDDRRIYVGVTATY